MSSKKLSKPNKQDKAWQQRIEKRIKVENVKIDHPKGKEQFEQTISRVLKKPSVTHKR